MSRFIFAAFTVFVCAPLLARAAEPPPVLPPSAGTARAASREDAQLERLAKALATELESVDDKDSTLNEWLQVFSKLTKENFVLDPSLPRSVGETKVSVRVQKGSCVLDALGVALALTGLRYSVADGLIFISTEDRLTDRVAGRGGAEPVGAELARKPLTQGEALTKIHGGDIFRDEWPDERYFAGAPLGRVWEPPRYNPRTGMTDYPGPPVWEIDPRYLWQPYYMYTTTPHFLKPEYLYLEQQKREAREERDRQERQERQASAQALAALLQFMKDHPDMKVEEVLRRLGQEKK